MKRFFAKSPQPIQNFIKLFFISFIILSIVVICITNFTCLTMTTLGEFGDAFGFLNAFFSGISLIVVVYTFYQNEIISRDEQLLLDKPYLFLNHNNHSLKENEEKVDSLNFYIAKGPIYQLRIQIGEKTINAACIALSDSEGPTGEHRTTINLSKITDDGTGYPASKILNQPFYISYIDKVGRSWRDTIKILPLENDDIHNLSIIEESEIKTPRTKLIR